MVLSAALRSGAMPWIELRHEPRDREQAVEARAPHGDSAHRRAAQGEWRGVEMGARARGDEAESANGATKVPQTGRIDRRTGFQKNRNR